MRMRLGVISLSLTGLFVSSSVVGAQTMPADAGVALAPAPQAEAPSRISADAGVTFTTAYVSHGIVLEDQGLITQPYADLYISLYEGKSGAVQKITLFGGAWSSLHSNHEFAADDHLSSWYEFDWNAGVSIDFLDRWNLGISYIQYTSPSDSFSSAQAVQLKLAYNDSASPVSLMPYAAVLIETDGKAGSGTREGYKLELGIAPSIPLTNPNGDYPVKLTFPAVVGLGFHDFYGNRSGDDELLGYASAGAVASVPLKFMSEGGYGDWSLSAGVNLYYFGSGTRWANAAGAYTDDPWLLVGSVTLGVAF